MTKPKSVNMLENSVNKTSTTVNHLAIRCLWQNRNDIIGDIVQVIRAYGKFRVLSGKPDIFTGWTFVRQSDLEF